MQLLSNVLYQVKTWTNWEIAVERDEISVFTGDTFLSITAEDKQCIEFADLPKNIIPVGILQTGIISSLIVKLK